MTNYERQQRFRKAHPGYYRKYYRKESPEERRLALLAVLQSLEAEKAQVEAIDHQTGGINAVSDQMV